MWRFHLLGVLVRNFMALPFVYGAEFYFSSICHTLVCVVDLPTFDRIFSIQAKMFFTHEIISGWRETFRNKGFVPVAVGTCTQSLFYVVYDFQSDI